RGARCLSPLALPKQPPVSGTPNKIGRGLSRRSVSRGGFSGVFLLLRGVWPFGFTPIFLGCFRPPAKGRNLFYISGWCEGTFCPRTCRMELERELQPKMHYAGASRTEQRIAVSYVGRGATAAKC